jgi:hypothetical protein
LMCVAFRFVAVTLMSGNRSRLDGRVQLAAQHATC